MSDVESDIEDDVGNEEGVVVANDPADEEMTSLLSSGRRASKKSTSVSQPKKSYLLRCLTPKFEIYTSQFLSSWGYRMWAFAEGLFLIEITPGSLRLVAVYNLATSLTTIIFGSAVGRWVDRRNRLAAIRTSLIVENLMVILCTTVLCFLIAYQPFFASALNGWAEIMMQVVVILLACAATVGNLGSTITVEKDWIVVISKGRAGTLATLNSVLRTIDLSTQILAPILVGTVMTEFGIIIGGVMIGIWNVFVIIVQYYLLRHLYNNVADLRKPKLANTSDSGTNVNEGSSVMAKTKDAVLMWMKYFVHEIKFAGLALAFLYMTVIAFDNYTVAYLYENGMSKWLLGIFAGLASVSGVLGAVTFPSLHKRLGIFKTGIIGFNFELFCLSFCVLSLFVPGTIFDPSAILNPDSYFIPSEEVGKNDSAITTPLPEVAKDVTSVSFLLFGIITSRFGLWLADLTVTQILQEDVLESERGGINGVQYSLNQSLSLLRSALIVILPTLPTFGYLVILSFMFVATASILFCIYVGREKRLNEGELKRSKIFKSNFYTELSTS